MSSSLKRRLDALEGRGEGEVTVLVKQDQTPDQWEAERAEANRRSNGGVVIIVRRDIDEDDC